MKKDIHPEYRPVVFKDSSTGFSMLTRSTQTSTQTTEWEDGEEYPLITVEVSSDSHPFYTGEQRLLDTAGRVERFRERYARTRGSKTGGPKAAAPAGDQGSEDGSEEAEPRE